MDGLSTASFPVTSTPSTLRLPLQAAIDRGRQRLLALQKADGHWVGELQGDTILESEFILLLAFLGRETDERVTKAARYIRAQQQPDGGWSNYPGGPADVSVSVKAYFALKIAGHDANADYMKRAREVIRGLGGAAACNSFTKFYLALLGEFPYDNCASVPPEMVLLPKWAYVNIYAFSSWTRTIVVPLSIFSAHRPVRHLPEALGIRELFLLPPETPLWPHPPTGQWFSWTNFFLGTDWLYKKLSPVLGPVRRWAVKKAAQWMNDHCADSDGVGAIFPPMIYTVVALRCLGYADDAPAMRWALKQLDDLGIEEGDTLRLQPCFSPVWDTALTLIGLADAGHVGPEMTRGVRWLLDREVRQPGDWSETNPGLEPGGWFFEYRNYLYPDTDDTAMVLMALDRALGAEGKRIRSTASGVAVSDRPESVQVTEPLPLAAVTDAARRGLRWLLAMQNRDGGWAAFDRDINRELLTKVPFADHNAMLDPSCPDITGRVLEALGHFGIGIDYLEVQKAIAFLERTQEASGAWPGRWGVNYIYGTWQVLAGLRRIGYDMNAPMVRQAVDWLQQVQQPGGCWGESCASYDDPSLAGQGTPTASQTAWALLGLLAAGEHESETVRRGIRYLLDTQRADGNWHEEPFTGTGFPKVFYLKYHMYSLYFPVMALARYLQGVRGQGPGVSEENGSL
jgi:squalene-hopene/tetraprenyl-beta-curcumene cyclase